MYIDFGIAASTAERIQSSSVTRLAIGPCGNTILDA